MQRNLMQDTLGVCYVPSFPPVSDITLIIFSIKEKAIATFLCFKRIVSAVDEQLLDASYFK